MHDIIVKLGSHFNTTLGDQHTSNLPPPSVIRTRIPDLSLLSLQVFNPVLNDFTYLNKLSLTLQGYPVVDDRSIVIAVQLGSRSSPSELQKT